ncbi:MAG: hypothetical protein ACLTX3_08040 [Lachnospiraceae bacterium]
MNEFAINWIKGADYAEVTVPSGTALKSKLLNICRRTTGRGQSCDREQRRFHGLPRSCQFHKGKSTKESIGRTAEVARERFVKMWAEKQESGSAEELPEDLMEEFLEEEI